jgi:hypothetical protein
VIDICLLPSVCTLVLSPLWCCVRSARKQHIHNPLDIHFKKEYTQKELHELQYTLLLFLNHLGTDDKNEEILESSEIEMKINRESEENTISVDVCKISEIESKPEAEETINEIIIH